MLICVSVFFTGCGGKDSAEKGEISPKEFYGTYRIRNFVDADDIYLSIVEKKNDTNESSKKEYICNYVIFGTSDSGKYIKGSCKITDKNYAVLYKNKEVYKTLIYSNGKYYYINNKEEPLIVDKISKEPEIPGNYKE